MTDYVQDLFATFRLRSVIVPCRKARCSIARPPVAPNGRPAAVGRARDAHRSKSLPARRPVGPPVTARAAPVSAPVEVGVRPDVVVGPVVTITVPRPAYSEFDPRTLKVDALRQARARAGSGNCADKAERNHRPCECSHDMSFLVSRPTPNPCPGQLMPELFCSDGTSEVWQPVAEAPPVPKPLSWRPMQMSALHRWQFVPELRRNRAEATKRTWQIR